MKKVYRLPEKGMLAGICAGLGELFSIDPTIIRLGVTFVCILTGVFPMVGAYAVGWIIIPEKEEINENGTD